MSEIAHLKAVVTADINGFQKGMSDVRRELSTTAAAAKQSTSAISGLGASLLSGGLALGVSAAIAGLIALGKELFGLTEAQKRLNDVLDGAKSSYVKAVLEVDKLKDAFANAKTGVISKESALKLYNSTIGKTIGQTNDLDIAEKNFIANADNYIKYTLLKAAANVALGKAAEQAFEAEKERQLGATKDGFFTLQNIMSGLTPGGPGFQSNELRNTLRVSEALSKKIDFQQIYNSLIAQANTFGFTGIEQSEKEVKVIEKKTKAVKEYKQELERINPRVFSFLQDAKPERTTGKNTVTPDILVSPTFTVDPDAESRILKALNEWLNKIKLEKFREDMNEKIQDTLSGIGTDLVTGTADAIGASLANGGKGLIPNLFGALISNVGQQISDLGKFLVKAGVQMVVAKKALKALNLTPATAIIAGAALVALGAVLRAEANKKYQGFASGVRDFGGGVALVGERGPELVNLPRGSGVTPNNELNAYGGGGQRLEVFGMLTGSDIYFSNKRTGEQFGRTI